MQTAAEIEARVLRGGEDPARRAIFRRCFAQGPPRKLVRLAERLDLGRVRALDVGCGHGVYLVHFSAGSVGVDRSSERVAFTRSLGLEALVRDVEAPGWTDGLGRFDVVWLADILVHLDDPQRFFASLDPVLAPDARVVVSEWLWPEHAALRNLLASFVPGGREVLDAPDHRRAYGRRSLAELLAGSGFEIDASWNHTFASALARALTDSFWPPRTILARRKTHANLKGARGPDPYRGPAR